MFKTFKSWKTYPKIKGDQSKCPPVKRKKGTDYISIYIVQIQLVQWASNFLASAPQRDIFVIMKMKTADTDR